MEKGAVISDCGFYRYRLWRRWGRGRHVLWVMHNPSTADADQDDPTIRRCVGFARQWGCEGIEVVNLYAFRSSNPKVLRTVARPAGPRNQEIVEKLFAVAVADAWPVVVAWGALRSWQSRIQAASILQWCNEADAAPKCLGTTKGGYPRHPLYVRRDQKLLIFKGG